MTPDEATKVIERAHNMGNTTAPKVIKLLRAHLTIVFSGRHDGQVEHSQQRIVYWTNWLEERGYDASNLPQQD